MNKNKLDSFVDEVDKVWCFPETAMEVLALIDSQDVNITEVVDMLVRDQRLVGRVLQIANSPFYGLSGAIGSIKEACIIIGLNSLRRIVLAAGLAGAMADTRQSRKDEYSAWLHAIHVAEMSRLIAKKANLNEDTAFTIGLLHDIGEALIVLVSPDVRDEVDARMEEAGCSLLEAEEMVLGFNHGELGEKIAGRWRLPSDVIRAIAVHHTPTQDDLSSYVGVIYLANNLCRKLINYGEKNLGNDAMSEEIISALCIKEDEVANLHVEAKESLEKILESFVSMGMNSGHDR